MWREALQPHVSGVSTDMLLFSERGVPLIHHYRVFGGGSAHTSLRGNYMLRLRAFAAQAEADARWALHRNTARPAVTATSAHPREVRQRDADVNLPRRKSHQEASPHKPIAPAVPASSLIPTVPVGSSSTTSSVTLVRPSATMDAFPPYAGLSGPDLPTLSRASDVPGYLPMTSPVTPQRPLLLDGLETPTLGGAGIFRSPRLRHLAPGEHY